MACNHFQMACMSDNPVQRAYIKVNAYTSSLLYFEVTVSKQRKMEAAQVRLINPQPLNATPYPDRLGPVKDTPAVEIKSTIEEPPRPKFDLEDHPIDQVRPIKVGIIGAGLSGISAGVLLPAKVPGLDLRIYDKNADIVSTSLSLWQCANS